MNPFHLTAVLAFVGALPALGAPDKKAEPPPPKTVFPNLKDIVPPELRMSTKAKKKQRPRVLEFKANYGPNRTVSLASRDSAVKTQFGSTCTTFGLIAAMENLAGGRTDLAERHLWSLYQQYMTTPALRAAQRTRIVAEAAWPSRQAARPLRLPAGLLRITDAPYLGDSVQSVIASIDKGYPVYFASEVLQDFANCKITIGARSPVLRGAGHAYVVVGYRVDASAATGGFFLVKNSWGPRCGDKGYQWMPFGICTRADTSCYAWAIRALAAA